MSRLSLRAVRETLTDICLFVGVVGSLITVASGVALMLTEYPVFAIVSFTSLITGVLLVATTE